MARKRPTDITLHLESVRDWARRHREEQGAVKQDINRMDFSNPPRKPWLPLKFRAKTRVREAYEFHEANKAGVHAAVDAWGREITAQQTRLEGVVTIHKRAPLQSEQSNANVAIAREKSAALRAKQTHLKGYGERRGKL